MNLQAWPFSHIQPPEDTLSAKQIWIRIWTRSLARCVTWIMYLLFLASIFSTLKKQNIYSISFVWGSTFSFIPVSSTEPKSQCWNDSASEGPDLSLACISHSASSASKLYCTEQSEKFVKNADSSDQTHQILIPRSARRFQKSACLTSTSKVAMIYLLLITFKEKEKLQQMWASFIYDPLSSQE